MDTAIRLIEAIAKLIGSFAWPVAIVVGVWLVVGKQRDAVRRLLGRVTKFSYPGGEAVLAEQVHQQEENVAEIAQMLRRSILNTDAGSETPSPQPQPSEPPSVNGPSSIGSRKPSGGETITGGHHGVAASGDRNTEALIDRLSRESQRLGRAQQIMELRKPNPGAVCDDIELALLLWDKDAPPLTSAPLTSVMASILADVVRQTHWRRRLFEALEDRSPELANEVKSLVSSARVRPEDFGRILEPEPTRTIMFDVMDDLKWSTARRLTKRIAR